jgi:glycosyltransferase involved in cell wall biosynthesis
MLLVTGFLLKCIGLKWIADILDDPGIGFETGRFNSIQSIYQYFLNWIVKQTLKKADLVITLYFMGRSLNKIYGVDTKHLKEISNGVLLDNFEINKLNVNKKKSGFLILYVGHVSWKRGLRLMCSVTLRLKDRIKFFKVMLVGPINPKEKESIMALVNAEGIDNHIVFTGEMPHKDVLKLLGEADVCLYPFPRTKVCEYVSPIKVFEYMAFGKPVIASNLEGIRPIVTHGKEGFLLDPNDDETWASVIYELYLNRIHKKKMGDRALQKVRQFNWNKINSLVINEIKTVLF